MKTKTLSLTFILIFFLSNCQIVQPTTQPTLENVASETPVLTDINNHPDWFTRQCLNISNAPSEVKMPSGYLILAESLNNGSYKFFNIKNMVEQAFLPVNNSIWDVKVSPNQQLMLYLDGSNSPWLNKIASLDKEINQFPDSKSWASVAWLDNEHIISGNTTSTPTSTFKIYNYLTGEETILTLDTPNPLYWIHPTGKNILIASINPEIDRVVYFDKNDGGRIIFWDNRSNRILSSLPYPIHESNGQVVLPAVPFFDGWSPDGKDFITTSPLVVSETEEVIVEELFQFNYDGKITQLTQFSDFYGFVRITQPVWSPSGEFIAFWLAVSDNGNQTLDTLNQQLVILNKKTNEIKDLCLQFGESKYSSAAPQPIWSPDSNYFVVETRMPDGKPLVNLVNIEENNLFTLQEGFLPVGWLISP
ncbi:MAG: hypothetical protein JNK81_09840 [Anaerolineales bacterium]|nr:hypothetical protein [Anaerolineales bacterium]